MAFAPVKLKPESGANRINSADDACSFVPHIRFSYQNKPRWQVAKQALNNVCASDTGEILAWRAFRAAAAAEGWLVLSAADKDNSESCPLFLKSLRDRALPPNVNDVSVSLDHAQAVPPFPSLDRLGQFIMLQLFDQPLDGRYRISRSCGSKWSAMMKAASLSTARMMAWSRSFIPAPHIRMPCLPDRFQRATYRP